MLIQREILLILTVIYAVVVSFLVFLLACFMLSCHLKFGILRSIKGYFVDPDRFDHGMIAQVFVGIVGSSIWTYIIGIINISSTCHFWIAPCDFLMLLGPLVALPTISAFRNTGVGDAIGLYGGVAGFFTYVAASYATGVNRGGLGADSAFTTTMSLWLFLTIGGYLAAWITGAIIVSQKKCEKLIFSFDLKVKTLEQLLEDVPGIICETIGKAYAKLGFQSPNVSESTSGFVATEVKSTFAGAGDVKLTLWYASPQRRILEEIRRTRLTRSSYRTPSQLLAAYLNLFASYNTVITLRAKDALGVEMGVSVFHESPSFTWCPVAVFRLSEQLHDQLTRSLRSAGYPITDVAPPSLLTFPGNIQRSNLYRVDALYQVRPSLSVRLSAEYNGRLEFVKELALESTRMDEIRESNLVRLGVLFLNSILAVLYSAIVQAVISLH